MNARATVLSTVVLCLALLSIIAQSQPAEAGDNGTSMNALVLLDTSKPAAKWGREYVIPYLDHFGVPYHTVDLAVTDIEACWDCHPLIIISHPGALGQVNAAEVLEGVNNGAGLVSFDPDFPKRAATGTQDKAETLYFDTDHYITAMHKDAPTRKLFAPMSLPNVTADDISVLVKAGDAPLLIAQQHGKGRIVQWTSQQWMSPAVLGPLAGLDDCLWRSIVWVARKPFAMRPLPPIVTMRVDDVAGRGGLFNQSPLYWVKTCGKYNFKPWLGLFIYNLTPEAVEELCGYINEGIATASPHALGRPPRPNENQDFYYSPDAPALRVDSYDEFIYFDHHKSKPWSDEEIARSLKAVDDWYAETKLPMAGYLVPHFYEIGENAIPHVSEKWHMEFAVFNQQPGLPYGASSPWVRCGPFRLHQKPGPSAAHGQSATPRPVYCADFVDVAGYKFFNCLTEIRDDAGYEWAPDNDVQATIGRGVRQLRRALDSKALAVLFTHETDFIYKITPENWDKEIKAIAEGITDYNPIYMTTDDALKLVRAHRTSKLASCMYDPSARTVKAELTGITDVPTSFYLYSADGDGIGSQLIEVPVFSEKTIIEAKCR